MSAEEDLDQFEAEVELELYREYRAVFPMFRYVVETERRFYLANNVKVTPSRVPGPPTSRSSSATPGSGTCTARRRFVSSVHVVTYKDVNVEALPKDEVWKSPRAVLPLTPRPAAP